MSHLRRGKLVRDCRRGNLSVKQGYKIHAFLISVNQNYNKKMKNFSKKMQKKLQDKKMFVRLQCTIILIQYLI